jgi:hypothetical protein
MDAVSTAEAAEVVLSQAQAMIDVRHYAEASALLARLLASEPSGPACCLLAMARLGEGDHAGAIASANQAIAINPVDAWPHRLASSALWQSVPFFAPVIAIFLSRRVAMIFWREER